MSTVHCRDHLSPRLDQPAAPCVATLDAAAGHAVELGAELAGRAVWPDVVSVADSMGHTDAASAVEQTVELADFELVA